MLVIQATLIRRRRQEGGLQERGKGLDLRLQVHTLAPETGVDHCSGRRALWQHQTAANLVWLDDGRKVWVGPSEADPVILVRALLLHPEQGPALVLTSGVAGSRNLTEVVAGSRNPTEAAPHRL